MWSPLQAVPTTGGALHGAPVKLLLGLAGPTEATTSARRRDKIRRPVFSFLVVVR